MPNWMQMHNGERKLVDLCARFADFLAVFCCCMWHAMDLCHN